MVTAEDNNFHLGWDWIVDRKNRFWSEATQINTMRGYTNLIEVEIKHSLSQHKLIG